MCKRNKISDKFKIVFAVKKYGKEVAMFYAATVPLIELPMRQLICKAHTIDILFTRSTVI